MTKYINHVYSLSSGDIRGLLNPACSQFLLQLLVLFQAPVYALLFWWVSGSEVNALGGFVFGSMATIVTVLFQCRYDRNRQACSVISGHISRVLGKHRKAMLWLAQALLTFTALTSHAM